MLPGDLYLEERSHLFKGSPRLAAGSQWSVTIRGPSIRSCGILRARKRKNAQARYPDRDLCRRHHSHPPLGDAHDSWINKGSYRNAAGEWGQIKTCRCVFGPPPSS